MIQTTLEGRSPVQPSQNPALHFAGFPFEITGYGAAARAYLHAFHAGGIGLSVESLARSSVRAIDDVLIAPWIAPRSGSSLTICHTEPAALPATLEPFEEMIVLTTWESDRLPDSFVRSLNRVREVWVPSRYNLDCFQRQLSVPVFQLPHPLSVPAASVAATSEIDQICNLQASDFVFLSIATWQERKNLISTIEAFFRAFPTEPNVKLLLKTSFRFVQADTASARIADRLKSALPHLDPKSILARLRVVDLAVPGPYIDAIMRRANAYLSLHRGEGWCYPLFDAACAGKPVVATAYSGPLDYLSSDFHHLVRCNLVPVTRGDDPAGFPFNPEMIWAEPDIHHAAEQLRSIFDGYPAACHRAETGAALLRQRYSYQTVGNLARHRLEFLAGSR